jgi:phenylpropionate dioxygenase-like ring-hydroxylating dioxygenase large terminal subunit
VTGYLDDASLIDRILEHLDQGTTDTSHATWREPVAHYRSTERLRAEVELLRRVPVPFCPSAALPEAGSYLARDAAGVPIVVVRGEEDGVKAFRNVCRHRGAVVVDGSGCARSWSCPYHGWTYRTDGSLLQVPDEYGFPGLDRSARGLVEVIAVEHGGLVFVCQEGDSKQSGATAAIHDWIATDRRLLGTAQFEVDANWKVLTEGFIEGYHLRATHRTTFLPFGYDNVTVVEHDGPNSRVTFPFRRIEALRDIARHDRVLGGNATLVHQVFPNVIVAQLSHHTTMVVLEPLAVDKTKLVTFQLSNGGSGGDTDVAAQRDATFVATGALEDNAVAVRVQHGFCGGANEFLEFGRFEGALAHFHEHLTAAIEGVVR